MHNDTQKIVYLIANVLQKSLVFLGLLEKVSLSPPKICLAHANVIITAQFFIMKNVHHGKTIWFLLYILP